MSYIAYLIPSITLWTCRCPFWPLFPVPPFSRAAEGDFDLLGVLYVFPVLYDSRVHVSSSLSHAPVCFHSCSPSSTHPLLFLSLAAKNYFGLESLLAVSLPFRSSRHSHAERLHPWIASAAAGCPLDSGMSVRGGRERKEGPKEGDEGSSNGGEGEVAKCSTESTHTAADEVGGGGDAD